MLVGSIRRWGIGPHKKSWTSTTETKKQAKQANKRVSGKRGAAQWYLDDALAGGPTTTSFPDTLECLGEVVVAGCGDVVPGAG